MVEKADPLIDSKNEVLVLRLGGRVRRVEMEYEVDCCEVPKMWWLTERSSVGAATQGKVRGVILVKSSATW